LSLCVLIAFAVCLVDLAHAAPPDPRFETEITFSGYDRPEPLTNFPVLVELGAGITGFSYTNFLSPTDGADLRFRRADNDLELNYEIENWDTNGTSHVWVQVDALASNTAIYAMWGNTNWSEAPACRTNGHGMRNAQIFWLLGLVIFVVAIVPYVVAQYVSPVNLNDVAGNWELSSKYQGFMTIGQSSPIRITTNSSL